MRKRKKEEEGFKLSLRSFGWVLYEPEKFCIETKTEP